MALRVGAGTGAGRCLFRHAGRARFPIGNFIRSADSLDYLEEPDCFHDIFGHVPMLAHEPVARLMQAMGRLGVEAIAAGHGEIISRLYWHTVEFGLAREGGEVKILGAGLASSFGEAHFAIEADVPRPRFTLRMQPRRPIAAMRSSRSISCRIRWSGRRLHWNRSTWRD